jgi:hypothetical protein
MNLTELQSKLLTHNPRLLSCAEAGMPHFSKQKTNTKTIWS